MLVLLDEVQQYSDENLVDQIAEEKQKCGLSVLVEQLKQHEEEEGGVVLQGGVEQSELGLIDEEKIGEQLVSESVTWFYDLLELVPCCQLMGWYSVGKRL